MLKMHFWLRSTAIASYLLAGTLHAAPEGFCLIEGDATLPFIGLDGCYIVKVGKHAIIRWNSFSVNKGETFRFEQEDSESSVINLVIGGSESAISGNVQSNGLIYLDHPNKIFVAPDGVLSAPQIVLVSEQGSVEVNGALTATDPSGKGGKIQVLGKEVDIQRTAVIDASGAFGEGEVFIGGSFQGKDRSIPHSRKTIVQAGAQISVDSLEFGNGGRAIIWSDENTQFTGQINARGGAEGGDGGFVEVSGKKELGFDGTVTTEAPNGKTGQLLLDPSSVYLSDASGTITCPPGGIPFNYPGVTLYVSLSSIFTALISSNISIQADNFLEWYSTTAQTYTIPTGKTLSLYSGGSIQMTGPFSLNVGNGFFNAYVNAYGGDTIVPNAPRKLTVNTQAKIYVSGGFIILGAAPNLVNPALGAVVSINDIKTVLGLHLTQPLPSNVSINAITPKPKGTSTGGGLRPIPWDGSIGNGED
jgi:filamentous hemagglutinin family protein